MLHATVYDEMKHTCFVLCVACVGACTGVALTYCGQRLHHMVQHMLI